MPKVILGSHLLINPFPYALGSLPVPNRINYSRFGGIPTVIEVVLLQKEALDCNSQGLRMGRHSILFRSVRFGLYWVAAAGPV